MSRIQLTISMLVSDRPETLGKCLASLKPLLRELDSELIVVFTGKNEKTYHIFAAVISGPVLGSAHWLL